MGTMNCLQRIMFQATNLELLSWTQSFTNLRSRPYFTAS